MQIADLEYIGLDDDPNKKFMVSWYNPFNDSFDFEYVTSYENTIERYHSLECVGMEDIELMEVSTLLED